MEETRKHKSHYFPNLKQRQVRKNSNIEGNGNGNSETGIYNSQKPVNFLFSNENDLDDDDDDT